MCYCYRAQWTGNFFPNGQEARDLFINENPLFFNLLRYCDEPETQKKVEEIEERIAVMERTKKEEALKQERLGELQQEATKAQKVADERSKALKAQTLNYLSEDARLAQMEATKKREALQAASAEQTAPAGSDAVTTVGDAVSAEKSVFQMPENATPPSQTPAMSDEAVKGVVGQQGDMGSEFIFCCSFLVRTD
jgi:hypothetical protein